ncbi:MAG: response regulator [Desulfobacterales bacterium]
MDTVNEKNTGHLRLEDRPDWGLNRRDDLVAETVAICEAAQIDAFEGALPQTLERIATFFRGDRCYACEVDESCKMIINRIEWCGPVLTRNDKPANDLPVALSTQYLSGLQRGETVRLAEPSEPGTTTHHKSLSGGAVIRSSLLAPMVSGGVMIGFLGVDITTAEMSPTREEVDVLKTLAGIIGLALGCVRSEKKRRLFQIAVEQAAELVLITNSAGTIEYVNPALERITGYASSELIGSNPRILKSGLQKPVFYQELWNTISKGHPWQGCFINRRKCGTHYSAEAVIVPVTDGTGSICNYVGIKRDVTQENHLQRQLIQSQKMEAIGTLAGGIAHDFNNILSAILGYAELAVYEIPEGGPGRHDVAEVIKAGNRAKDLVRQILTFSRKTEQDFKSIDIAPLLKEALKFLRASLPSTIDIRTRISAENARVLCTPTMIQQILMNLCTNAAQAMKDSGGILDVSLTKTEIETAEIKQHPGLRPGPHLRLTVGDTGPGIEPDILARIFDPYFTTKEKGEGTGLGLSVVHGIIQALKGSVQVDSCPDSGAIFHVFLPCAASQDEPTVIQPIALPTGNEQILLVDDEEVLAAMGKQMLEHLGYRVTVRTGSSDALNTFQSQPQDFDLVISDRTMPRMTGFELAKRIKTIRPDIPIILCTGYSDELEIERAAALGISRMVMKPLGMNELADAVRSALDTAEPQD